MDPTDAHAAVPSQHVAPARADGLAGPAAASRGKAETLAARRRSPWLWIAALLLGAAALAVANQRMPLVPSRWIVPSPAWLAIACALHGPYLWLRSARLVWVLDPGASTRDDAAHGAWDRRAARRELVATGLLGYYVAFLLPLRTGELARPLLLSGATRWQTPLPQAIGAVAFERAIDGAFVVGMVLFGLLVADLDADATAETIWVRRSALVLGAGFSLVLAALIAVALAPDPPASDKGQPTRAWAWGLALFRRVGRGLRPALSRRQGPRFLALSGAYWGVTVSQFACLAWAFGVPVSGSGAALCVGIIGLSIQLPTGPAHAGGYQLGAAAAWSLLALGVDAIPAEATTAVVLTSYALHVVGGGLGALVGALVLGRGASRVRDDDARVGGTDGEPDDRPGPAPAASPQADRADPSRAGLRH